MTEFDGVYDVLVVGGGIVGLASARAITLREPGARVLVVEKEPTIGRHQTSRNSGVVHAGIYYAPGSLKARMCTAGRAAMKEYTAEKGLPYDECGKLIIALHEGELDRLAELERRATANEVPGVRRLDAKEIKEIEPACTGIAALHSPVTAITDFGAVAASYARDIQDAGGSVVCNFRVSKIDENDKVVTVTAEDGRSVSAKKVVVCAGLWSDAVAVLAGDTASPRIVPFRGDYYALKPELAKQVRGLVYPVPDPDLPFLGVHLTRMINGEVYVGPNAVLAGAREGYSLGVIRPKEIARVLASPAFLRFAKKNWRTGFTEMRRAVSPQLFAREAAAYMPIITRKDLVRAPSGVRAQALDATGGMVEDFRINKVGNVVLVRNAPSPAATSSLMIGAEVADSALA